MSENPQLPAAYELIVVNNVGSLRDEAVRRAKEGAEEGTLIWANHQQNARGRLNHSWECQESDLHCSIILRPDFPAEQYYQMLSVAVVSMGNAIAVHLTPMIALLYGWPNDIKIGDYKIAGFWLDSGTDDTPWLTITCSVNIMNSPDDFSIPAISINEAEGKTELTSQLLLETYAREFISQINNWSERGYGYIMNLWKARFDDVEKLVRLQLENREIEGTLQSIDDCGNIHVSQEGDQDRLYSISQYMGVPEK